MVPGTQIHKYKGTPGTQYDITWVRQESTRYTGTQQPALSWRASGDRQISLSASDERAFANFRVKNVVFTGTHFCAVLSMVGERAFANFYSKTLFFTSTHFCAFTGGRLCQLVELCSTAESTDAAEVLSLLLAECRIIEGGAYTQKTKVRGLIKYIQSSKSG